MKDYVKYGRARDQLYHYKVSIRQLHEGISPHRRTRQLLQLLEMVESVVETVCEALERDQLVAMQLDIYDIVPLPGFDEQFPDMKNPYQPDRD